MYRLNGKNNEREGDFERGGRVHTLGERQAVLEILEVPTEAAREQTVVHNYTCTRVIRQIYEYN